MGASIKTLPRRGSTQSLEKVLTLSYNSSNDARYVRWIQQNMAKLTSGKALLKDVLQRCTNSFLTTPQYKNDERYVYLCLSYVSTTCCQYKLTS